MKIGPFRVKMKRGTFRLVTRTLVSLIVLFFLMGIVIHMGIPHLPDDSSTLDDPSRFTQGSRSPSAYSQQQASPSGSGTFLRRGQSFSPDAQDNDDFEAGFFGLEPSEPDAPVLGELPEQDRPHRSAAAAARSAASAAAAAANPAISAPGLTPPKEEPAGKGVFLGKVDSNKEARKAPEIRSGSRQKYCDRFKDVRVFRFKGFPQQGTTWGESLLTTLISWGCRETGACMASPFSLDSGIDAEFPECDNKRWTFVSKTKHSNHAGKAKAAMLGAVSLLAVRDPRDSLVALYQNRQMTDNLTLAEFFESSFEKMLQYMTHNIGRVREDGGFLLRYEELHRHPVPELLHASEVMGLTPTEDLVAKVVRERSHKTFGFGKDLQVEAAFNRKPEGRTEDVFCRVGEYKEVEDFVDLLPRANEAMRTLLPDDIASYYLTL